MDPGSESNVPSNEHGDEERYTKSLSKEHGHQDEVSELHLSEVAFKGSGFLKDEIKTLVKRGLVLAFSIPFSLLD